LVDRPLIVSPAGSIIAMSAPPGLPLDLGAEASLGSGRGTELAVNLASWRSLPRDELQDRRRRQHRFHAKAMAVAARKFAVIGVAQLQGSRSADRAAAFWGSETRGPRLEGAVVVAGRRPR